MKFKKNKARIRILSDVLSFPMLGDLWTSEYRDREAIVGDLVSMQSAPTSKFYLSWLREIDENNGWPRYLLESIEDGSLDWWSNIGISFYDRERSSSEYWHWDDDQYAFDDRWKRVFSINRAYGLCSMTPKFNEKSVTLSIRARWTDDIIASRDFENWKKLKSSVMDEFYLETERAYDNSLKKELDN
jgi:hypothetical protein